MLLYAVYVEEWDVWTWYETTKERYENSTDKKKVVPVYSIDDIPDDLFFEEKRLIEVRVALALEQKITDDYESAKYLADMEYEVECIANGADPLDFHRHC